MSVFSPEEVAKLQAAGNEVRSAPARTRESAPDTRTHAGGARALHARLHRQAAGRRVRALAVCIAALPRCYRTRATF
jgi:hypothetical protein